MRYSAVEKSNIMAKKKTLTNKGDKPMSFKKAIGLAIETPHLTRKQIDELKKQGKLDDLINRMR